MKFLKATTFMYHKATFFTFCDLVTKDLSWIKCCFFGVLKFHKATIFMYHKATTFKAGHNLVTQKSAEFFYVKFRMQNGFICCQEVPQSNLI